MYNMKEHNHKILDRRELPNGGFVANLDTSECEACKEVAKENREREVYKERNTVSLDCDKCGTNLGRAYEGDLNGSRFYCNGCVE